MDIKIVSDNLSMTFEQAQEVCNLFDNLSPKLGKPQLKEPMDYVDYWGKYWYRYFSFEELIKSEVEQGGWEGNENTWYNQAKDFCEKELNNTIFKLPCGMYAQYV